MTDERCLNLTDAALAALGITCPEIADAIEAAVLAQARGGLMTAPKSGITPGDGRYVMSTLATGADPALTVVKVVSVHPHNPARGLPAINGAILVLDAETGLLRAVMGANWITAVRTAGLSTVVARRLADPASRVLACIGAGVQARSHLDAFAAEFPLGTVRIFGRGPDNIARLAEHARAHGLSAEICPTADAAVEGADLVVSSVTRSTLEAPFVDAAQLKPGAHAAIIDLAGPWRPETMTAFGTIVIDDLEQEAAMAGKMVDPSLVAGDLAGLLSGRIGAAFRADVSSAFVFRGQALGDWAVAALAWQRATGITGCPDAAI